MFTGAHILLYAKDAERARAFFRDVLELRCVDAGEGWLIFALPPAELGVHPVMDVEHHRLYLMTSDVNAAVRKLAARGVTCAPVENQGFGLMTSFEIPGGGTLGMYEPRHPTAIDMPA